MKNIFHAKIDQANLIFSLIPKNANTSCKLALIETFYKDQYSKCLDTLKLNNDSFHAKTLNIFNYISNAELFISDMYFRVAVIRNPYDRLLVGYINKISKLHLTNRKSRFGFTHNNKPITFEMFINQIINTEVDKLDHHFMPQYKFLTFNDSILLNDYLIRYEDLDNGWKELQIMLSEKYDIDLSDLPHCNETKKDISKYFTQDLADKVYNFYKRDFELFTYHKNDF